MSTCLAERPAAVLLAVLLFALPTAAREPQIGDELLANGGFEKLDDRGLPLGWRGFAGGRARTEGGNTWLEISRYGSCSQIVRLDPNWMKLKLRFRMRVTGVRRGDDGWKNARLAMEWRDAAGKHVDPWPDVVWAEGTADWQTHERVFLIPRGAAKLDIAPAMFGQPGGKAEYDDLSLTLVRRRVTRKADLPLPKGAALEWDLKGAWRRASRTRERICLNGLWRFLPVPDGPAETPPPAGEGWGFFKVPGIWPRAADGEAQDLLLAPWMEDRTDLRTLDRAWYRRTLTVPAAWRGRQVLVDFTMLQTHARVFLDGEAAGELFFPGGELDVTKHVKPGEQQALAILVTARPLAKERAAFMAPDRVVTSKASIALRGLTGDVFLAARPPGERIDDVRVVTSTRERRIALDVKLAGAGRRRLRASVSEGGRVVKRFFSPRFDAASLPDGRISFGGPWLDPKLWDVHTPENLYDVTVTLLEDERDRVGRVLDETLPIRFGFREFRADGRDLYLNGKRIHLRALLSRNINRAADVACRARCRETCRRLKDYGFNFLITANYHFQPGTVGYMDGLFAAADETGVLASFSLPHFRDFDSKLDRPEQAARYRALCEWLIRRVRHHPSVVMYAMSHNATGYKGDQNPLRIDGVFRPDDPALGGGPNRNRAQARLAAKIARDLDPTRPVYHHQSGNLGDLYTINIYLNWAPKQERSDWLEHWATEGTKPLFFVEWGLPHVSSWSSYRGPNFIWRSEEYQSIWDAEYNAAYLGDAAYEPTPQRIRSREWEEELWGRGRPFHWGQLIRYFRDDEQHHVRMKALFADDNWRCLRTWGVSAMLPWDQGNLWRRSADYRAQPADVPDETALHGLARPGIVPDRLLPSESHLYALGKGGVEPTVLGRSFLRWNLPLCAYIGGASGAFTDKGHNFLPGESTQKQVLLLNDTREEIACTYACAVVPEANWRQLQREGKAPKPHWGGARAVAPGDKVAAPFDVRLPIDAKPGAYRIVASFDFGPGGRQKDELALHVLPEPKPLRLRSRIALFDPRGLTAKLLDSLGATYQKVDADADVSKFRVLIIGREAIGPTTKLPDVTAVRGGLKVLVFEQTPEALSRRLGFRVNVHGLRQAFARAGSHPALAHLGDEHLRDWRGSATLTPPHLDIRGVEKDNPRWSWCGFRNTRVWRCGNRGCVAGVLIEKPPVGDFRPIVDGGFDLQYAPLLEYVEGAGRVVFCQMDVTGRTGNDPAAMALCRNLLRYLDADRPPAPSRGVRYAGDERGSALLGRLGIRVEPLGDRPLGRDILVLGPGAGRLGDLTDKINNGACVVGLGLSQKDIERVAAGKVKVEEAPIPPLDVQDMSDPALAGVARADLHWRAKLTGAALAPTTGRSSRALRVLGIGKGRLVLCQVAPWMLDGENKPYLRTSYRRNVFLISRILHNLGAATRTPLLARLGRAAEIDEFPLPPKWVGRVDRDGVGRKEAWWRPGLDDHRWKPIAVPGMFDEQVPGLTAEYNGLFWYRLRFRAPAGLKTEGLTLHLGPADDESWVWLNGRFLGEVTKKTNPKDYWTFPRTYAMKPGTLKPGGENVLVVLVNDTYQTGGLTGAPRLAAPGAWLGSYYVQEPVAGDDPYRYYRW